MTRIASSRPVCGRFLCRGGRVVTLIDPWYDYFAFPIAPLVLVAQLVGLFLRTLAIRWMLLVTGPLLIGAMLAYVTTRPVRADEGVNIGEGVLVLCLLASLALTLLALLFEGVRGIRAARLRRAR